MKLKALFIPCVLAMAVFSSCLKSTPYLDVSHTQPILEFGISPANGWDGPFQYDSSGSSLETDIDTAVGLVIASPQVLGQSYTVTVAIDTTQLSEWNNNQNNPGFTFTLMPSSLYTIDTTCTIGAGYRIGRIPVSLKLSQLPLMTAYALPLKISNSDGLLTSGATYPNSSAQFMWWFYRWY